jgi:hypothetical protein
MTLTAWSRTVAAASTTVLLPLAVPAAARTGGHAQPAVDTCAKVNAPRDVTVQRICRQVRHLGFGTFNELNLLPAGWDILRAINPNATGRLELAAKRHFFAHGPFVFTVLTDGRQHVDMVVRTAAALDSLRTARPSAYEFLTSTLRFPTAPPLANTNRIDRSGVVVFSFDKTPDHVAAAVQVDGRFVFADDLQLYTNVGLISIDEETIVGNEADNGSRRIYRLPTDSANYRRYMTDGVIFSMVHEMAHLHISHIRGSSRLAAAIYEARADTGAARQQVKDAEEIIANETAMALLGSFLSEEMTAEVRRENLLLARKTGVRDRLMRYAALPVDARNLLVVPQ